MGIGIDKDNNVYAIYEAHILLRKKAIEGLTIEPALYLAADCISCFRHELIYSGKSQNTLHFTYREFKSEFTRPSFTQELRYDLEDGAIIGFKNTRIKVLKTDNATIDYIILNY